MDTKEHILTRMLEPADLARTYSRRSRLIALQGPRGALLARYPSHEPPDLTRHAFLTQFPEDYPVFDGSRVPEEAPPDVEAIAWPVEQARDPRVSARMPSGPRRSVWPQFLCIPSYSQLVRGIVKLFG